MGEGLFIGLFIGIIGTYIYFRVSDKEKLYHLKIHIRKSIKKDLETHIYCLNKILENYRKTFSHLNTMSSDRLIISKGETHLLNTNVFFSQISDVENVFIGKEYNYLIETYSALRKYYNSDPYKIMDLYTNQWKTNFIGSDRLIKISDTELNSAHIYLKKGLDETLNIYKEVDDTLHYLKMKPWKNNQPKDYYISAT